MIAGKLGDEGSVFFGELITHMLSLNSNDECALLGSSPARMLAFCFRVSLRFKGSNSVPEGSTLFVRRAYLWQVCAFYSMPLPSSSHQLKACSMCHCDCRLCAC